MEVNRDDRKTKIWACPNQSCGNEIGKVLGGELILDGIRCNTSGPNLVTTCPKCGTTKVWYTQDRLSLLLSELADHVARKIAKSQ
jgi:hypothetical protein